MLSKKTIIESYVKIIIDSLIMIHNSTIVTNLQNAKHITHNIINTVIHVFHLAILNDATIESIFLDCQKACFCYLEYIEQMTKTNLLELDNATISAFVYKQSLTGYKPATSSMTHIFQYNDLLHIMKQLTHTFMAWVNNGPSTYDVSLKAKIANCDVYLGNYIKLFYNLKPHSPDKHCQLVDTIRQKTKMNEDAFFAFLGEYYNLLYNLKKQNKMVTNLTIDHHILGWSVTDGCEICDEKKVKKFTKQLFLC